MLLKYGFQMNKSTPIPIFEEDGKEIANI